LKAKNSKYFIGFLISAINLSHCASGEKEEIEFDLYRSPMASYKEMTAIGVTNIDGLTQASTDYLTNKIKRCGQFSTTKQLDTKFSLKENDVKKLGKSIGSQMDGFKDARSVHGALIVKVIRNKGSITKQNRKLVLLKEKSEYQWFPSFGNWPYKSYGFTGSSEVAPVTKAVIRDVGSSTRRYDISIKFALYNKVIKKVVYQDTYSARSSVTNYSGQSNDIGRKLRQSMTQGILDRIVMKICPKVKKVERNLYARGTDDKIDTMIQAGIELAEDGRWQPAATKWRNAILEDKSNALAHHNLGVFYEKHGDIPKAAEYFDKAEGKNYWKIIEKNRYETTIDEFVPRIEMDKLQPRIITVSGGKWLTIIGGPSKKFKKGKTYPLFRSVRHSPKPKFVAEGIDLVEVGRIKVVKRNGSVVLARIKEFIEDERVEIGDVVLLK